MNLGNLLVLASEAGGSGELGLFETIAKRWNAGGFGMYPIALCGVVATAIVVERVIVLFFSAASRLRFPKFICGVASKLLGAVMASVPDYALAEWIRI